MQDQQPKLPEQIHSTAPSVIGAETDEKQTTPKKGLSGNTNVRASTHGSNKNSRVKSQVDDSIFKESAVKYLLGGQYNDLIKNEDGQKSIELNSEEPIDIKAIEAFLDHLEHYDLSFRYCRLCESILAD